jgi:hypothetical protein
MFTQVEISAGAHRDHTDKGEPYEPEQIRLLREIAAAQDRQNELLEELVSQLSATHRQRNQELSHWKASNPDLAKSCRRAAKTLSRVQTEFLDTLTSEVNANAEALADGEFVLNEFVDRFGPRLAHLNGMLQVLAQLSGPQPTNS